MRKIGYSLFVVFICLLTGIIRAVAFGGSAYQMYYKADVVGVSTSQPDGLRKGEDIFRRHPTELPDYNRSLAEETLVEDIVSNLWYQNIISPNDYATINKTRDIVRHHVREFMRNKDQARDRLKKVD